MNRVWEAGDQVVKRRIKTDALLGRNYVLQVIALGRKPFLELRKIDCCDESRLFVYRINGCKRLETAVKRGGNGKQIFLPTYLKMMWLVLEAVEQAEEQMVLASTFLIDENTVFYHEDTDSVRFAYVPCPKRERSAGELLLELLQWTKNVDFGFHGRWPILEETFIRLRDTNAGRHRCMETLQQWRREFPETESLGKEGRWM